jgi:hypothetical protein
VLLDRTLVEQTAPAQPAKGAIAYAADDGIQHRRRQGRKGAEANAAGVVGNEDVVSNDAVK